MSRNRGASRLWLAALTAMLTTLSSSMLVGTPAHAAYGCSSPVGEYHADFQGWSWGNVWYCGNAGGAAMYAAANTNTHVAWMDSTYSWFVCWRRGAWHSGGNDVWYYSQGDRSVGGQGHRGAWGFMPAANVWTTVDPHPEMPQCPADPIAAPARTDGLGKPVYFIHGYDLGMDPPIWNYWGNTINYFRSGGPAPYLSSGNVITFCYYTRLTGCTVNIGGTTDNPLYGVGRALAWDIYYRHSQYGRAVDLIGHSMGGLVAKAAVTGVSNQDPNFPPYLYVEDGVTISTPNAGLTHLAVIGCMSVDTPQCSDMRSVNWFIKDWVKAAPASTIHTDWTFIGADDDVFIVSSTAVPDAMLVGHKVQYDSGQITQLPAHNGILSTTTGLKNYIWCDLDVNRAVNPYCQNKSLFTHTYGGHNPVYMARLSVQWKDTY